MRDNSLSADSTLAFHGSKLFLRSSCVSYYNLRPKWACPINCYGLSVMIHIKLRDFEPIYRSVVTPQNEAGNVFEKHKQWVDDFISIGKRRKGYGASKLTPYIHALLYQVSFFVQKYGSLNIFSCQSVEKKK